VPRSNVSRRRAGASPTVCIPAPGGQRLRSELAAATPIAYDELSHRGTHPPP
jgi:hypothetical protein